MSPSLRPASASVAIAACVLLGGCQNQNWNVKRVDPQKAVDVDYRFNDEDAREIFHQMSADALARPWVESFMRTHNEQRPIVYLASVKNNTEDYINTNLFTNQLQEDLINSGKVRLKVERDLRPELRDERLDTKFNDPATLKKIAAELNADFALVGSIEDNKQRTADGKIVVNYYQARMELIDIETAEKVWIRTAEIKKVARR